MARARTKARKRKRPTDQELAAMALSFVLQHSTDTQLKVILSKTLQDWADWCWPTPIRKAAI